ncbi:hypothetical protein Sango_1890700 [Sesamum angolense]|uniref:Uncharacterized protein n=1 Tax=Sesamum angolense TaxID=2727404 RepID=A0AAE1WJ87_9LAMI|nr:hypothetical protein Sango_1890700 [Sesamum angolense]
MQSGRVIFLLLMMVLPDNGTRSCPIDVDHSSYCYGDGPYNYGMVAPNLNCTKKLIKNLGLPIEKIDACKNGCMLYWKDNVDLEYCKFYGNTKYKPTKERDTSRKKSYVVLRYLSLTPRLQRLHSSRVTAEHMTWHDKHQTDEGSMCHPSDIEVWKHFDHMYPDFSKEPHNIRLRLYTNGFTPHDQYLHTYLYWPVIIIPYNLSPSMCMSSEYMFLTMVIPDPSNLKYLIDVYLEPLIEELVQLWYVGFRNGQRIHHAGGVDVEGSGSAREARRKRGK